MDQVRAGYAIDASTMAENLGNLRAANTVLLGALSTALDFPEEDWLETIRGFVPSKTIDINMKAFAEGRTWALAGDKHVDESTTGLHQTHDTIRHDQIETTLEITQEWCKGCDICVKMCPGRCIRLNDHLIAELALPDLCTGCRMCEWLCPDFAIKITNTLMLEATE